MIPGLLALTCMLGGALLEVQTLPWTPGQSTCFLADATRDGAAEVFVLEGNRLRIYNRRDQSPLFDLELAPGTAAVDVADVNLDGTPDLVMVNGDAIQTWALTADTEPETRFTLENRYSHANGLPFPCVLVVDREEKPRIALPREDTLEIRALDGTLAESFPVDTRAPHHIALKRPFTYWVNQHAQTGGAAALEFRVSSVVSYRPLLPDEAAPAELTLPDARPGTQRQLREATPDDPEAWPWFSVGADAEEGFRALYRNTAARDTTTAIRIRTRPTGEAGGEETIGPVRHYPGALILRQDSTPDFNGDGFADILLWKTRKPGFTPDAIARAAARKGWPVSVSAHLFLPEKQRFAPRPMGHLTVDIPVTWWFSVSRFGPLRNVLLRDFDGDGRTDFGCQTRADTLSIWQAGENGFDQEPAFEHQFPGPVERIHFEADLEGNGSTSIGLESGGALYVLRPWSPLSEF